MDEDEVKKVEDVKFDRISDPALVLLKCNSTLSNTNMISRAFGSKTPV